MFLQVLDIFKACIYTHSARKHEPLVLYLILMKIKKFQRYVSNMGSIFTGIFISMCKKLIIKIDILQTCFSWINIPASKPASPTCLFSQNFYQYNPVEVLRTDITVSIINRWLSCILFLNLAIT